MKPYKFYLSIIVSAIIISSLTITGAFSQPINKSVDGVNIKLPEPNFNGTVSVEKALLNRRSMRDYQDAPLDINQLSQILWAAQGITDSAGHRTAPSAGADYPLALYIVAGNITGLSKGLYKYIPKGHMLARVSDGDLRPEIFQISINQLHILNAAFLLIYTEDKTISKVYAKKSDQKVNTEVGASLQNVFLQGVAMGLGVAVSTSWDEVKLKDILKLGNNIEPLIIQTIGVKK